MIKDRKLLIGICILWAVLVATGAATVLSYQNRPGLSAPIADWPAEGAIKPAEHGDTLVMLAHPRCPCTRASLAELYRVMALANGRLTAYVIFIKPQGFPVEWEKTDLWTTAAAIPGVHVILDQNGAEAERFQAATSGQVMLYDNAGKLLFSGGITKSRGHEGGNIGSDSIIAILNNGNAPQNESPIYGCPLFASKNETSVKGSTQ